MVLVDAKPANISKAAALLRDGGVVAMPTETVYGLAGDATNAEAIARIFTIKVRPAHNPLIVHVSDMKAIEAFAVMNERAQSLAQAFWPGPMTLILPLRDGHSLAPAVTAGLPSVAVRIPAHKTARALIEEAACPIAAPSANLSGQLSPTSAAHVAQSLGNTVDMTLADGRSAVGLESSVIDVSGDQTYLLRHGAITAEDIARLGIELSDYESDEVKSPGQLLKHYAPRIPIRLNAVDVAPDEALLAFGSLKFMGLQGGGSASDLPDTHMRNLSETQDLHEAASNLFAMLHDLDKAGAARIAVMNIPATGLGIAINDRLQRAAASVE